MLSEKPILLTPDCKVAQNLLLKRDLLKEDNPEHQKVKTGILIDGGVMKGAFSGGVVIGLEKSGLRDVFDWAIGMSAGACALAYFLAGQTELGTSIYYEDLVSGRMIDFKRLHRVADMDLLIEIMKGTRGSKRLDIEALLKSRSNFLVAVTETESAQVQYIDPRKTGVDPISLLHASTAMPVAYLIDRGINLLDGTFCDGGIGFCQPINYMVNELGCTDILVIMHREFDGKGFNSNIFLRLVESIASTVYLRKFSRELKKAFMSWRERSDELFDSILSNRYSALGVNLALVCMPKNEIDMFTMNPQQLIWLKDQGRQQIERVFGKLEV